MVSTNAIRTEYCGFARVECSLWTYPLPCSVRSQRSGRVIGRI